MNNKTDRKVRTSVDVVWPTTLYFTTADLIGLNPNFKKITLRVRLKKAVDELRSVAVIGTLKGLAGRPALVYTLTPVAKAAVDEAVANGVVLVSESELVKILDVVPSSTVPVVNSVEQTAITAVE